MEWTHSRSLHPNLDHSLLVASPGQPPLVELVLDLQLSLPNFFVRQIIANFLLNAGEAPSGRSLAVLGSTELLLLSLALTPDHRGHHLCDPVHHSDGSIPHNAKLIF